MSPRDTTTVLRHPPLLPELQFAIDLPRGWVEHADDDLPLPGMLCVRARSADGVGPRLAVSLTQPPVGVSLERWGAFVDARDDWQVHERRVHTGLRRPETVRVVERHGLVRFTRSVDVAGRHLEAHLLGTADELQRSMDLGRRCLDSLLVVQAPDEPAAVSVDLFGGSTMHLPAGWRAIPTPIGAVLECRLEPAVRIAVVRCEAEGTPIEHVIAGMGFAVLGRAVDATSQWDQPWASEPLCCRAPDGGLWTLRARRFAAHGGWFVAVLGIDGTVSPVGALRVTTCLDGLAAQARFVERMREGFVAVRRSG